MNILYKVEKKRRKKPIAYILAMHQNSCYPNFTFMNIKHAFNPNLTVLPKTKRTLNYKIIIKIVKEF